MRRPSLSLGFAAVLGLALLTFGPAVEPASAHPCPTHTPSPAGTPANEVVQHFPPAGPMQTAWRVRFAHASGKGLFITGAWFKRAPGEDWMRVLFDARLAEIFVPYHYESDTRFLDLTMGFDLVDAQPIDTGACGKILDKVVVREVNERGLIWKNDEKGYRGHELVLWATLDAANYNYIIRYAFRDEGTVALRIGATATNLPWAWDDAHMHNGLWRIDLDLAGAKGDSVAVMKHKERYKASDPDVAKPATDEFEPVLKEGAFDWQSHFFTELHVTDSSRTNRHGALLTYEVRPIRLGTARHYEKWARNDFWVTRFKAAERSWTELPKYVQDKESVDNTDLVVWHMSPLHHIPRYEDWGDSGGVFSGSALLMWGGVDLRPRDLFDETPFHP